MVDLETFEPFRKLSPAGKELLATGLVQKQCAPASLVLQRGQRISGAYFVIRGRLRVFSLAPSGNEATLYFIDPGETCVFALNSLFNDLLYPAWVQSESATTVALIPGPVFRKLFECETTIQDVTVHALSTIVYRLMAELEQVHAYKLEQRLANLILLHASAQGELRMTQQQIAHHLGTTREVVARLMREFVAKRYVETKRGLTVVRNASGLTGLVTHNGVVHPRVPVNGARVRE
jgi:CRP/FNR family transcriptional regulator, anaerobic regulatory protein